MQYMGGKAKIARKVVAAILADVESRQTWVEPFVGGGNIAEHAVPHFQEAICTDLHPDLILMWQAVAAGWVPPDLDKERYYALKQSAPSAERGYAGFGASFGGKWFGGFGVSPRDGEVWRASQRALARQGKVFQEHKTLFWQLSYADLHPTDGDVVYCDPPYASTTGYATGAFDHDSFYAVLMEWARNGAAVYVSEYSTPELVPVQLVWQQEKRNVLDSKENSRTVTELLVKVTP